MSGEPDDAGWSRLVDLVWKPEKTRLERLEANWNPVPTVDTVSRALPDALREPGHTPLGQALSGPISRSLRCQVRRNRESLIELLTPTLGAMVRRSIRLSLQRIMGHLNRVADYRLNPIAYYRAKKSGLTLMEYAELQSLIYRVESVSLLDRNGNSLGEWYNGEKARPSLALTELPGGYLQNRYEGMNLSLAAVIYGEATPALHERFRSVLEALHCRPEGCNPEPSAEFVEKSRLQIESLMTEESKDNGPISWIRLLLFFFTLFLLFLSVGAHLYLKGQERSQALRDFALQPGILVSRVDDSTIYALKDPLAPTFRIPDGFEVKWESFQSPEPYFVRRRLEKVLEAPSSVQIEFADNNVRVRGRADRRWSEQARVRAATILGPRSYDDSGLELLESMP